MLALVVGQVWALEEVVVVVRVLAKVELVQVQVLARLLSLLSR